MSGRLLRAAFVLVVLVLIGPRAAAEPPATEMLPPPHPLPPAVGMPPPVPVEYMLFRRHNPYEVWQHYGVNRFGQWRPLVISTAEGAWYTNGAPYPWAATHPELYVPRAIEPANFRR